MQAAANGMTHLPSGPVRESNRIRREESVLRGIITVGTAGDAGCSELHVQHGDLSQKRSRARGSSVQMPFVTENEAP